MADHVVALILKAEDQASGVLGKVGGVLGKMGPLGVAGAAGVAAIGAGVAIVAKEVFDFSKETTGALKLFSAQTGLVGADLALVKEVAKDVWKEGFGENITDVVDNMSLVQLGLQGTAEQTGEWTKKAMTLATVYKTDVAESMSWVSSLTDSMGVSAEEAFDVITKGMQMGLDVGGDFGDTLNEYSSDFDRLGFSSGQMLAILNSGLEAGAHNTDVVADGWREFGIKLNEGGDDMADVFDDLGLSYEDMAEQVASGDKTWGDYSETILDGLGAVDDELLRNKLGVGLFGTKWEDVGGDVFLAAQGIGEGIKGITGATEAAAETVAGGMGPAVERLKRTVIEGLAPLGDKAGELLMKLMPHIETFTEWLSVNIPVAIEVLGGFWTSTLEPIFNDLVEFLKDPVMPILAEFGAWLGEMIPQAMDEIKKFWKSTLAPIFQDIVKFIKDPLLPIVGQIVEFFKENIPVAFKFLKGIWNTVLKPLFATIVKIIKDPVLPIIGKIVEFFATNIPKAFRILKGIWETILRPLFGKLVGFIKDPVLKIVGQIVEFFAENIPKAIDVLVGFWNNTLKPMFESIVRFVSETLLPAISGIAEGFKNTFDKALGFVKSIFNGIIGLVERGVNSVIDAINGLIDRIPDSVLGISLGVKPGHVGHISLPRLDEGGMVLGEQMLALLHGPELVLPLDSPGTANLLATAMSDAMHGVSGSRGGQPIEIHNHFGRDSVRSDKDIMAIADSITHNMTLRGIGRPV